jgi:hypothetical protein
MIEFNFNWIIIIIIIIIIITVLKRGKAIPVTSRGGP